MIGKGLQWFAIVWRGSSRLAAAAAQTGGDTQCAANIDRGMVSHGPARAARHAHAMAWQREALMAKKFPNKRSHSTGVYHQALLTPCFHQVGLQKQTLSTSLRK